MPSDTASPVSFAESWRIAGICCDQWSAISAQVLIRDQRISRVFDKGEATYVATFAVTVRPDSVRESTEAVEKAIEIVKRGLGSTDLMITVDGQRTQLRGPDLDMKTYYVDLSLTVAGPGSKPMVW